jgi:hypothetical protein
MPIPLIPILTALAAGGSLVPHAAGGMIVTAAGGYVTGTYISTAAIASLMTGATIAATIGTCAALLKGGASTVISSAGIFGTAIRATKLTKSLTSAGILSSTPIAVPLAMGVVVLGTIYILFPIFNLRRKLRPAREGEEIVFTEKEAIIVEAAIKLMPKKNPSA